ncbi:MAG: hypothetical protein WA761_03965 [Thermoplasmata archaeon]
MIGRSFGGVTWLRFGILALAILPSGFSLVPGPFGHTLGVPSGVGAHLTGDTGVVSNFTSALDRLVDLVAVAGSAVLTLVWARVAFSWFSNDVTKKIQAKDRARDALVGTLLFTAALTGMAWGLAHWVLTGT